ncbi:amphi-Trp domain-containing protein [Haloterrigena alkaliphila]|uniref:DUF1508 domain-containing protein n=1 Tax=Haloterrigena alkaliphila TaxID=2816475 RepID=A0A8A2VAQ7_9EURY|nr:amphi-Trp domain-containing protein [Haloterrigena alkaliphila]QSW97790.1 DUF1508 domain-containing protein [Haloterrigena alkaliphila]
MDDSPSEFDEIELERAYDREELADVFREFAGALADDHPIRIDDGERTATVTVPERVVAEFEAERETDDPPVAELELELEWDDPDGSTLRIAESEGDEPGISIEGGDEDGGEASDAGETGGGETGQEPADSAAAEGEGGTDGRTSRFEVYEDRAEEWRWRLVHWNGNIVADSGEGYTSRSNARRAARSVMRSAPNAALTDRDD